MAEATIADLSSGSTEPQDGSGRTKADKPAPDRGAPSPVRDEQKRRNLLQRHPWLSAAAALLIVGMQPATAKAPEPNVRVVVDDASRRACKYLGLVTVRKALGTNKAGGALRKALRAPWGSLSGHKSAASLLRRCMPPSTAR